MLRENKLRITGNCTADMEFQEYEGANGKFNVASFTLAVNRIPTKENPEPGCDFINVRVYGWYAERIAEMGVAKGDKVTAEGELRVNTKKQDDGTYRTFVHLKASNITNWSAWSEYQGRRTVTTIETVDESVPACPF